MHPLVFLPPIPQTVRTAEESASLTSTCNPISQKAKSKRQNTLTTTLLPRTRIPTIKTPLPRTRLGRPRLFLYIHTLKEPTRHIQPKLPHVPKAPRDVVRPARHEIPVGEPAKEVSLARVGVGHELCLAAVRREPAGQDMFPLGHGGVGRHFRGGEWRGGGSREGGVRRGENEGIGKVGVAGLLPLREEKRRETGVEPAEDDDVVKFCVLSRGSKTERRGMERLLT